LFYIFFYCYFFFFQAEDGIRDRNVTGVQTCALPIFAAYRNVQINNFSAVGDGKFTANQPVIAVQFMAENVMFNGINVTGFKNARSEERRVGKECKSQWSKEYCRTKEKIG